MTTWTTLSYIVSKQYVVYRGSPPIAHPLIRVRNTTDPRKAQFALPYNLEGADLAAQLELDFPDRIELTYDWASRELFASQIETARFLFRHPRAFVLSEMGTGKTRAVLTALSLVAEKANREGKRFRALVLSPLSTLEVVWANEIARVFPDKFTAVVLQGTTKQKTDALRRGLDLGDIFITNHDALLGMYHEFLQIEFTAIVIDEIAVFRNPHTERWRIANALINGGHKMYRNYRPPVYAWGLTGTPIPNLPTDAWGQKKLLLPDKAGQRIELEMKTMIATKSTKVKTKHSERSIITKWKIRPNAAKYIYRYLQPSIRFTRSDVYELPEETTTERSVPLTKEQQRLIRVLKTEAKTVVNARTVTIANAATFLNKALQIAAGAVLDDGGIAHHLAVPDRFAVVRDVVEQAAGKVLVFASYRASVMRIAEELASDYGVAVIHGDVSAEERARIFATFQRDDNELRVIVAHPKTMSHGVTLTAANTVLWYGPTWSAELYEQANARIARASQRHNRLIVHLHSNELERSVFELLRRRRSLQAETLALFEKFVLTI